MPTRVAEEAERICAFRSESHYTVIRPNMLRFTDGEFEKLLQKKVWEAEKANQEITAIAVDCSDLQYVSSAGLRVLLMMYKSLENKDNFQMTGVTDAVREILQTTGFDQFLLR